jgi:DMSO/TMAO reductase YedYZ heme-binding membrane subunit
MTVHLWWYLSRGAGIASWACGALSLAIGLSLASKATIKPRPVWQLVVHRHLAMLTLTSLAIHIAAIMLDGYTAFGVADILVPLHSSWKPLAVASGVVSMWILVTVEATSLAKQRLPQRAWSLIHRTSLLAYGLSTIHFLQAGSERHHLMTKVAVIAVTGVNITLLVFRVLADSRAPRSRTTNPTNLTNLTNPTNLTDPQRVGSVAG